MYHCDGGVDNGACTRVTEVIYGKSLYLPFIFAVNRKLLKNIKCILKNLPLYHKRTYPLGFLQYL